MRLFNKTIDRQLFKQYALGSDLSKQEVVAKIFNPMGAGTWFILNSDPNDPDYLWAIVDLGYGAEVGSVSRSDLETYRGRFGMGFERDLSFDPVNALELYNGLRQGKYYADGGSVNVGYNVFNYTDNIYATDEVFKTKALANKFIKEFRSRFSNQGYYRDNRMNKINIQDIDLLAIPSDFNPFKKYADGGLIQITKNSLPKEEVLYNFKKIGLDGKVQKESVGFVYYNKNLGGVPVFVNNKNDDFDYQELQKTGFTHYKKEFADGGQIEVVYERRADFKKKPIKLLLLNKGREQKGYTFSGKDQVAVLDNYNRNKQEDLERLWNLKGYESKYADGGEVTEEDYEKRLQYLKMMKNNERSDLGKYNIDKEIRQINTILEHRKNFKNSYADGGELVDYSDNQLMVMNQNVEVEHHHEELEDILKDKTPVPAWVVAKMETATQNLSDITHYLDGEKELMEDENEDENEEEDEDQDEIENKIVVEPIDVSAGTKTDLTKNFTDEAWGNLRGFLKGMEGVDLRDDYTFDYKDEQYEVEPIINSDENGVSNAVFNIFDGDGEEVGDVSYSRDGGKQKFTANSEFFSWNNAKFEDGGYFDGTIPKVSTYMSTYAKGGEVAKAEILGLSKNIMGTTSIEMKISGMRKSQDFSVYPIGKDDTDKIITIQSETRIGKIDLATGRGLMSQSHSNGAYFVHFQMDKLTPFTINEKDLKDITSHIFRTAGDNVGSRGIFSDNSGASGVYAKGGKIDNKDLEKLNAYWQSFYKGVMAGKKDEGYITITNKDELNKYITSKLGNVVKNIELIEKGKNYPYNDSYPYYEDIYSVELKNGTTFKIVRSYGRPRWQGNVDYKEQIIVENIKQYADGGNVEKPLTRFRVGESFRYKNNGSIIYTVTKVYNDGACEARDEEGDNYSFEFDELNELVKAENNYADGGGISLTKDFTILKDDFQKRENEPNRVYHSIEGLYKDNWFIAKTDNSFFKRYGSDGINKGGVYQLDVWKGGNPVGRDKSTTGGHVSEDHIAMYWNKWDYRSMKKADKQIVSEIVNLIDEKVTNTKRKLSSIKFADGGFMNNIYADGGQVRTFDTIFGKEIIFKEEQVGKFTIGISSGFNNRRHVFIYEGEIGKYGVKGLPKDFTQSPQLSVEFANNFYSNLKRKVQYNQDLRPFELIKDVKFLFADGGFMNDVYAKGGDFDYQFYEVSASTKNGYDLYKINGIEEQDVFVDNYKSIKEANDAGQKLGLEKRPMWLRYGKGGKMSNFDKLSAKVAKNYEGKPVQGKYQEEYGKVYSKAEAKEVGDKVAGKVKAMQPAKKEMGGETKKGRGGSEMLKQANILAKKIRKDGESWNDAKKRAFAQLKK